MEQIPIHDGERPDNVVPLPGGRIDPDDEPASEAVPPPAEHAVGPLLEQSARIVIGFASACAEAIAGAIREVTPDTVEDDDDALPNEGSPPPTPSSIGLTAGAAAGMALEMSQAALRAATSFAETAGPVLSWFANVPVVRRGLTDARETAQALNDRWAEERPVSQEAAAAFATKVIPELTSAIVDRIDLTQLAIDHVDIQRIVESIDLDAIVERVDIDAVIHRVDLAGIATEVIGEIDLPELIRGSTGAVTSETVRAVRMRSAEADLFMGRIIDRLLMRKPADDDDSSEASAG